jgi:small-conductance mechanosensitive channel
VIFASIDGDPIVAAATLVGAIVVAFLVDRFVLAHAGRAAERADLGTSRAARTRLRVVRRLIFVVIVGIGLVLALSQFTKLDKIAAGLFASTAVAGIIVGLAARQVLANPVAGIGLAISQPIRIGDAIELEGESGRVDDITLSYTYIDTRDGRLLVVPNEKVATSLLVNRSTGDRTAPATASVWVPLQANLGKARRALKSADGFDGVSVAEITAEGVRIEVQGRRDPERTVVGDEEAKLRESAHEALREAGLL